MRIIKLIQKNKEILLLLFLVFIFYHYFCNNDIENFTIEEDTTIEKRTIEFNKLMESFSEIFPDNNRNAGGAQFFHHIINMNLNKNDFELYNSFYCGVSGSPVDPNRKNIYDYIIVKDLNDNDIYGKYYRCCWPCLCDIMKYVMVDKYDISFNDGTYYTYDVLTIDDPCCNESNIPESVNSFRCSDNKTLNGIHSRSGRLIIALFYDTRIATENDELSIQNVMNKCSDRMNTEPDDLTGGMGDIFVKLALLCKGK